MSCDVGIHIESAWLLGPQKHHGWAWKFSHWWWTSC